MSQEMSGRNGRDQGYSKDFINRHMKAVKTKRQYLRRRRHRSGVYQQTFYRQWATSTVSRSTILGAYGNERRTAGAAPSVLEVVL